MITASEAEAAKWLRADTYGVMDDSPRSAGARGSTLSPLGRSVVTALEAELDQVQR